MSTVRGWDADQGVRRRLARSLGSLTNIGAQARHSRRARQGRRAESMLSGSWPRSERSGFGDHPHRLKQEASSPIDRASGGSWAAPPSSTSQGASGVALGCVPGADFSGAFIRSSNGAQNIVLNLVDDKEDGQLRPHNVRNRTRIGTTGSTFPSGAGLGGPESIRPIGARTKGESPAWRRLRVATMQRDVPRFVRPNLAISLLERAF